jgi:serpin B
VDDKVTLNIANAIFLNKNYTLKPQFTQDMQTYYDAKAEAFDFSASSTLDHINSWAKEKTNGMIPTILDEIDPSMVSYLLNAIYFKADWASKFDPKNTKNETFTTENDNSSTDIPMMHQNVLISYLKTDTYSAIILPYGTGLWNMTVLLPEKGKTTDDVIKEVAQSSILNNPGWCETGGNYFEGYEVDLKLPRFETSSDTDKLEDGLIGLMKKMGINRAFEDGLAEIPNMCELAVYIDMMRQKAKIKVNEEGSEAAAVTVAGVNFKSMGSVPAEYPKATFHANRPFVYVISEQSSGVILFVGKFTGA